MAKFAVEIEMKISQVSASVKLSAHKGSKLQVPECLAVC